MVFLLPQFKCPPDTLSTKYSTHHSNLLKAREPACSRAQCILAMATTMSTAMGMTTTVVDVEKQRLHSLEAHSNSVTADRPLTYIESIGPPTKTNFEATLATEALLAGEEAVIAAAAAEAIALAKAAFEIAQDLTLMAGHNPCAKSDSVPLYFASDTDVLWFKGVSFSEMERVSPICHHPVGAKTKQDEEHSIQFSLKDSENLDPTDDELKLQQMQLSTCIDVRSGRQTERRDRRARAAKKAAANVVSGKPGTSRRKKRVVLHEVDYSDPLRYLRGTTNTSRLLTATEELELSEGIQELLKLENLHQELAERCGVQPTFVQWAEAVGVDQKTLRKRINYGMLCKEKMVKSNIRLVISIAKNYQGAGMSLQDLVQEGCRGLVKGTEKFDASKGFKFSTYAHWWIKQAVRKSLSEQSRTIRLPCHMVEATYRVREAKKQLYSENGRHPDNKEIAEATGLSMKRLTAVLLTPRAPRSLDQKIGINQNLKPLDVITYPDAETTEDLLIKQFMQQDLEKVLDSLNPREKQVIQWRFGLKDGRMKTLQEIGELMCVSRERIRQIESCAFRKLKNKKRTKILRQYFVS